jgi:hypothetical protein
LSVYVFQYTAQEVAQVAKHPFRILALLSAHQYSDGIQGVEQEMWLELQLAVPNWGVAPSGKQERKLDPSAAFGQLLRKHRLRQKMSQEALAARSGSEPRFHQPYWVGEDQSIFAQHLRHLRVTGGEAFRLHPAGRAGVRLRVAVFNWAILIHRRGAILRLWEG